MKIRHQHLIDKADIIDSREDVKARRFWRTGRAGSGEISAIAVDCGLAIHRELGPGLLESVYETVLATKLERRGLKVERQRPVSIKYEDKEFPDAFRIDLLVDSQLVIEIKSVEALNKVHGKQLLTYLRLMYLPLGLLMNFGGVTFTEGLKRVVNNHKNFASSRLRVNQSKRAGPSTDGEWNEFFDRIHAPNFPDANEKYDENGKWIP